MNITGGFVFRGVPSTAYSINPALSQSAITDNVLKWANIPNADFRIYVFASAAETDPGKAVKFVTMDGITNEQFAAEAYPAHTGTSPVIEVSFDLTTLGLSPGSYFIRLQAIAEKYPVRGLTPATVWGQDSPLSIALAYEAGGGGSGDGGGGTYVPPPAQEKPKPVHSLPGKTVSPAEPTEQQADKVAEAVKALSTSEGTSTGAEISQAGPAIVVKAGIKEPTIVKVALPEDVDWTKISTMAKLNDDGTLTAVPTKINADGTIDVVLDDDAILVPLHSGTFFTDIGQLLQHVQDEINTAALRMIVNGTGGGKYAPTDAVTIQQTVTMFLRALGIPVDWATAMSTAAQFGLTAPGAEPGMPMTRINTATVIVSALKALGFTTSLDAAEVDKLLSAFSDMDGVSAKQREEMALCVKLGIFRGNTDGTMDPQGMLKRMHMASLAVRLQDVIFTGIK